MGWVADVFHPERLRRLPGHRALGHVRYSPAGSSNIRNAQPITANTARGPIAIAHNGNLTNADALRKEMERDGAIFQSNSDTEVILHLLARAPAGPLEEQISHALGQVKGAYSLLILTPDAMYAVRDPYGFRPLTLGRLADAWIVASETCALDLMEAKPERDVEPGELVVVSDAGMRSIRAFPPGERLQCVFEYVYFARPDSVLWGRNVHTARKELGRKIVKMIRGAGARAVHVRISSPPIQWPCYYGIDTPTRKELIGASHSVEEICRYLAADSLGYLSLDGMLKATGSDPAHFCHACFTGAYRVGMEPEQTPQLRLFDS